MATREREFAREEAAGLRAGDGVGVDGTVEGVDPGRDVAGSNPVGAKSSSDDEDEEEEEEEEVEKEEEEEVVEKGGEKGGEKGVEKDAAKEVEAKEEEEKDTESVDVDDGGTRLVAEDAEKEEESLRFFREFQTSRSARGPDRSPDRSDHRSPDRSSAENGFCFMDSSSSDSDAENADGNGASAATSSSSSSSAEWAERWEREQWERKHGGASFGAGQHSDDANRSFGKRQTRKANGRGYEEFHGGDPYGDDGTGSASSIPDDVFGADELAGILNESTRDRMVRLF